MTMSEGRRQSFGQECVDLEPTGSSMQRLKLKTVIQRPTQQPQQEIDAMKENSTRNSPGSVKGKPKYTHTSIKPKQAESR